jgi:hypothetical protein
MELLAVGFRFLLVEVCFRDRLSKTKLAASCERRDTASMDGIGATSGNFPLFGLPVIVDPVATLGQTINLVHSLQQVHVKAQLKNKPKTDPVSKRE